MVKTPDSFTSDLFGGLEQPVLHSENAPPLDLDAELTAAVKKAIRLSGYSRDQVVDRINLCLVDTGVKKVTKRMLNAWLAPSQDEKRIPAHIVPAICWATRSMLPMEALAGSLAHDLVDSRDQEALAYGELAIHKQRLERQLRQMGKKLST